MLIVQRQEQLLSLLREQGTMQLDDLAQQLGVSVSTVRRDLETLEQRGQVARTHGGAIYQGPGQRGPVGQRPAVAMMAERMHVQVSQKQAIGRYAASLVEPNMTLFLDGGSTVFYAAKQIEARPLQIVTNSLAVGHLFAYDDQVELLLVGGSLYPRTEMLVGPIAMGCLADLHADLLLFSQAGIFGRDVFNVNLAMAQLEQLMMRQATRSVLLMDSTKFGRKSLTRLCSVDELDQIVTDDGLDPVWREQLGDRLVCVPADPLEHIDA